MKKKSTVLAHEFSARRRDTPGFQDSGRDAINPNKPNAEEPRRILNRVSWADLLDAFCIDSMAR